jgi:hypothetical protein
MYLLHDFGVLVLLLHELVPFAPMLHLLLHRGDLGLYYRVKLRPLDVVREPLRDLLALFTLLNTLLLDHFVVRLDLLLVLLPVLAKVVN